MAKLDLEKSKVLDNAYAGGKGRMFDRWIDSVNGSARSNGLNENGLIEVASYIIESLLRDENFTERDMKVSSVVSTTKIIADKLASSEDDYYNYSVYYNVTTNHKTYIADYNGLTRELTLASADASVASGDNFFLQNVRGDFKIDCASFDLIGNSTNGTRKDWKFARSFDAKQIIFNYLDELAFELHCELIESIDPITCEKKYKLIDLDSDYSDVWTNPAYIGGLEQITARLSPLDNVYSQFRLLYWYDYGKNEYLKEIYIDKNGKPQTATILSDTEVNLCKFAEQAYLVSRLYEYSSKNIYDDVTAEKMLQKKIQWLTKQRLVIDYTSPIVGNFDFIKYEKGDKIKVSFPKSVPLGLDNNANFIISNKSIVALVAGGYIRWRLTEL